MARPKIPQDQKRIIQINVRLTLDEEAKVQHQATAAGQSPANWIRHKIVTGKFPVPKQSPLDLATYRELRRIGVNLNQAAHRLNRGEYAAEVSRLLTQLLQIHEIVLEKLVSHDSQSNKG